MQIAIVDLYDLNDAFISALNTIAANQWEGSESLFSDCAYKHHTVSYLVVISKNATPSELMSIEKPLLGFLTCLELSNAVLLENLSVTTPYNGISAMLVRDAIQKISADRKKTVILFMNRDSYKNADEFENMKKFYTGQSV